MSAEATAFLSATAELADRIPEILERVDLVAEVERLGGRVGRMAGGTTYMHCPGPDHDDGRPSFTVKAGRFRCRSQCAASGDAIDLLVWLEGVSKAEAIEQLAERYGIAASRQAAPQAPTDSQILDAFLARRGWGRHVADSLSLRVVRDRHRNARIRFPFRLRGAEVYHADRATGPGLKWLNATGSVPCPFEADRLQLAQRRGSVIVVEGITDTAALVNAYADPAVVGIPGVGALKAAWAPAFTGLEVYVIADRDAAGDTLRASADTLLGPVADVAHLHVPARYGDVADWIRAVGPEAFDVAISATGLAVAA